MMRFAILTSNNYASSRIRAEGLQRMFERIGVDSQILYRCLGTLTRLGVGYKPTRAFPLQILHDFRALASLVRYDVLILCDYIPTAFLKNHHGIELIRKVFPNKAIVLYVVSYLGNSPDWQNRIYNCGGYGISRYDWHLCVSPVGKKVLEPNQPCSAIGINLEHPELHPLEKKDFVALLDFERKGFESFREVQIQALEELEIEYVELHGNYTFSEIYEIYRRTSIYFLAFLESFGLPICETQICGNYVFTPDKHWPQAHRKPEDFVREGSVVLSKNFVVYKGLEDLKHKLTIVRTRHNHKSIYNNYLKNYPYFYYGNSEELKKFVERAKRGELWGRQYDEQEDRDEAIKRSYLMTPLWTATLSELKGMMNN
jgi:hypothetical protein